LNEDKSEGRLVLDRRNVPFTMVTNAVLKDRTLKASDKSVYATICLYADNETSDCYPSRETLMKDAGVSDKTLRNSLRRLADKGYIDIKHRYNKNGQSSNLYVLLDISNR
jgi:hypothetical protein